MNFGLLLLQPGVQQEKEFEVFAGAGGRVLYQFTVRVKLPKDASGGRYGF